MTTENEILDVLDRAQAVYFDDIWTFTRHVRSLNKEAPLTDDEKDTIRTYFAIRSPIYHGLKIVFDN